MSRANLSQRFPELIGLIGLIAGWLVGSGWLAAGEPGLKLRSGAPTADERSFWCFQPLTDPEPPPSRDAAWARSPIDRFIRARLEAEGLEPVPPADRRTLLRRVALDLTGLPPDPETMAAFLADEAPDAYGRAVERLLASPAHGERWGRHWLDLVRYADTAGETADFPVREAYLYRNYVIHAFNADKPYDQFLREQLAGDIIAAQGGDQSPERREEFITATGFIAIARRFGFDPENYHHLTVQDTIDTLGQAVLGLSLGCARCHDHKYDPVDMSDYYAWYGIFDSTVYAYPGSESSKRPRDFVALPRSPEELARAQAHDARLQAANAAVAAAEKEMETQAAALGEHAAGALRVLARGDVDDAKAAAFPAAGAALAVEVRAGEMLQLSVSPRANHGADSTAVELEIEEEGGAGRRWSLTRDAVDSLLAGNPHADGHGNGAVWCFLDARRGPRLLDDTRRSLDGKPGLDVWHHRDLPSVFVNPGAEPIDVWTRLPPRTFFAHPAADGPVAVGWLSPVTARVRVAGTVADVHAGGDGVGWRLEHFAADLAGGFRALGEATARLRTVQDARASLGPPPPPARTVYAVAEGKGHAARVQLRGEPREAGEEVPRRNLAILGGQPVQAGESGSGRWQLAEWLTRGDQPLAARVLANRIWRHHFGDGLVRTGNDFGRRGEPPSHPELLDWLASRLVESGWSIKTLHRLIVSSATYQLSSSAGAAPGARRDPDSRLRWRFSRRRLSAEEIRDSLLDASGELDRSPGEAHPFPPVDAWGFTQHAPFYGLYETNRRSVYLMQQRLKRHPFLAAFDGADPNVSTAERALTTTPAQALFLMNDPFVHARSGACATRLMASENEEAGRIRLAHELILVRPPQSSEMESAATFLARYRERLPAAGDDPGAREHAALAALVRTLFVRNEHLFVD